MGEWNGGTSHLKRLRKITLDGIHGEYGYAPGYGTVVREFSAYYRVVTELLVHFVNSAYNQHIGAAGPPADADADDTLLPPPLDDPGVDEAVD